MDKFERVHCFKKIMFSIIFLLASNMHEQIFMIHNRLSYSTSWGFPLKSFLLSASCARPPFGVTLCLLLQWHRVLGTSLMEVIPKGTPNRIFTQVLFSIWELSCTILQHDPSPLLLSTVGTVLRVIFPSGSKVCVEHPE